jgi:hypothetical protein
MGNKTPSSVDTSTIWVCFANPPRVLSEFNEVSIVVINSFLFVSIFVLVPLTNPIIIKSVVASLVAVEGEIVISVLVSFPDWTKQAGYCCSDNSSTLKGSRVIFFKVIGEVTAVRTVIMFDAISSRLLSI